MPVKKNIAAKTTRAAVKAVPVPKKVSAKKTPVRKRAAKKAAPPPVENLFISRDESWLRFNQRVLEEAQDPSNPLLERVKFLAITASNLDEFVEIRVASLLQRIEDGFDQPQRPDEGGLTLTQRLDRLSAVLYDFVDAQYTCWNKMLLPSLDAEHIHVLRWRDLDDVARTHALAFYENEVDPLLTPVTIDPSHPFPRVLNKALCIALLLRHKRKGTPVTKQGTILGVVTVPRSLPRLVPLPSAEGCTEFILLHELIESQVERMFRGYEVLSRAAFRVTRNSNLYLQEEESRSVLESVRAELHNRRKGDAVRMEIENSADTEIIERLRINFELDERQVFRTDGPVNLSRLMNLYSEVGRPDLKYPGFKGRTPPAGSQVRQPLRRGAEARHPAASSVRFVWHGRGVYRDGGARSRGHFDEADTLSHQRGLPALPRADRGGAVEGCDRRDRADGALR